MGTNIEVVSCYFLDGGGCRVLVRMSVEGRMMERSGTMMNQGVVEGRKGGAMILCCFVDMRGNLSWLLQYAELIRGGALTIWPGQNTGQVPAL